MKIVWLTFERKIEGNIVQFDPISLNLFKSVGCWWNAVDTLGQ